ncbi:protein of unknown function [Candidatus Methylocalor cossyra]|uniref:Uncharacterized protein n=1 Tax=Candidatus Methylocalor cossyra TaxID=3108543 RepID=A0ABP1C6T8_9GAMM
MKATPRVLAPAAGDRSALGPGRMLGLGHPRHELDLGAHQSRRRGFPAAPVPAAARPGRAQAAGGAAPIGA